MTERFGLIEKAIEKWSRSLSIEELDILKRTRTLISETLRKDILEDLDTQIACANLLAIDTIFNEVDPNYSPSQI